MRELPDLDLTAAPATKRADSAFDRESLRIENAQPEPTDIFARSVWENLFYLQGKWDPMSLFACSNPKENALLHLTNAYQHRPPINFYEKARESAAEEAPRLVRRHLNPFLMKYAGMVFRARNKSLWRVSGYETFGDYNLKTLRLAGDGGRTRTFKDAAYNWNLDCLTCVGWRPV